MKLSQKNKLLLASAAEKLKNQIGMSKDELVFVESESSHRPNFLLSHPKLGLIAIEFGGSSESTASIRSRLNDKLARLLREAPYLQEDDVVRISVVHGSNQEVKRIGGQAFTLGDQILERFEWIREIPVKSGSNFDFTRLSSLLNPEFVINLPVYEGVQDREHDSRQVLRIRLDSEQSKIAARSIEDVLIVTGGPGTGKTLVLLGRAKWLAEQHPDWKILIIVFNNMLLKHLRTIPDIPPSVKIVTLKRFLEVRGVKNLARLIIDFDNPERAESQADQIVKELNLKEDDVDIDALLIDEWQDFKAPFIQYLLSLVRHGRGGTLLAGDDKQAIYTDGYAEPFVKRKVDRVNLIKPYRSTKQILRVANALDDNYKIENIDLAPDGEPVTAIYAPFWPLQGEVIALEIQTLLATSKRRPGNIAVLCTTNQGAKHVAEALEAKSIPIRLLTKYWEDPEPSDEAVNIMTVHGGKGFGFEVVFIQGFETLKDRDGTAENKKWRRVGFVGATRAIDLLYIVYKTPTQFVSSILDLAKKSNDVVVGRIFPDDYKHLR